RRVRTFFPARAGDALNGSRRQNRNLFQFPKQLGNRLFALLGRVRKIHFGPCGTPGVDSEVDSVCLRQTYLRGQAPAFSGEGAVLTIALPERKVVKSG